MNIVPALLAICASSAFAVAQTDVQTARAGTPGLTYDLNAVVVVGNQDTVGSSSVASFFVRDSMDSFGAINIFMSQGDFDALSLQLGDVLDITAGTLDSFNGFAELTFPGGIAFSSGTPSVGAGAIAVNSADLLDGSGTAEGLESQRISIMAAAAAGDVGTAWAGGTNYVFNDGANDFTVRVATDDIADYLNLNYGNIGAGSLALEGIFGQFDASDSGTGYQLLLNDVVPSPASAALLGLGGLVATRRRRG